MAAHLRTVLLFVICGVATAARIQSRSNRKDAQRNSKSHSTSRESLTDSIASRHVKALSNRQPPLEPAVHSVGVGSLIQEKASQLSGALLAMVPVGTNSHVSRPVCLLCIAGFLVLCLWGTYFIMAWFMTKLVTESLNGDGKSISQAVSEPPDPCNSLNFDSCNSLASKESKRSHERKQHIYNDRVIYEWDQTSSVATMYLGIPVGLAKEDLEIQITSTSLTVGRKDQLPFLREASHKTIDVTQSAWRIRKCGELQIRLQKEEQEDWPCVLRVANQADGTSSAGTAAPQDAF